jgi:hypothetical protein
VLPFAGTASPSVLPFAGTASPSVLPFAGTRQPFGAAVRRHPA